jgi:hypothetical protein
MSGTMSGTEMTMEGEGELTEEIWFAFKEGILVEKTSSSFFEGTTAFTGQMSGTMPSTNESTSSVKLVKWKSE